MKALLGAPFLFEETSMMAVLLSIMAGSLAVIQAGTNKVISQSWGFSSALLLNGLVFLACNILLFSAVWWQPRLFPDDFLIQGKLTDFKMWWVIPGICGFLLVTGLVVSLNKIGAMQTFVICIASQILCGLLWDLLVEHRGLTPLRFCGAAITLVGALITNLGSSNS
jgi:uncharacterized membrane protein YdcZ (DUF606 family)